VSRCFGDGDPLYEAYHDDEWGHPVTDERGLFERVSLEAFQSGLSWLTILRKRDAFRAAFADFEVHCSLTKLLADTDHQLTGHLKLSWLNKHFQPITCLLVYCTVVGDPGTLQWSFQRRATKGVAHLSQDVPTRCGTDLCTVIAMRRNPCNHKQCDSLSPCGRQLRRMPNIVLYTVLSNKM
jgi:hypothetical protein